MVIETKKFPGLGGQGCLVEVNKRIDGSVYVVFRSEIGYGDPFIEMEQVEKLVEQMRQMRDE